MTQVVGEIIQKILPSLSHDSTNPDIGPNLDPSGVTRWVNEDVNSNTRGRHKANLQAENFVLKSHAIDSINDVDSSHCR